MIKICTFVRCVCGKERAWYIGLARKLIIFFFMECVNISIVNQNERKSASVSIMHEWGKRLSTALAGFVIV